MYTCTTLVSATRKCACYDHSAGRICVFLYVMVKWMNAEQMHFIVGPLNVISDMAYLLLDSESRN